MITLYDKSETNFEHNGIGSLEQDIIDPKIHWIDNGIFSFEFDYPLFAKHGLEITNSSIIKARDPEQDNLFFVYKVIPSMGYIKVYCYHIFYKLAFNTINDTNIVGKNGQGALTQLAGATQYPHKFQFTSDLTTSANSRVVRKNPVEILLDSNLDNSFINRWGGHIIRHGFNIRMNQSYGSNKGYKIQHKKDLIGYEATIDETTVVTRIRPVGYDGLLLPEIYIDSPLISSYPEPRIQEYTYSDVKVGNGEGEFATASLAYAELRRLAKLEFSQNKIDVPRGIYKVDFVNLKETEEYKNFAPLKQILPGDIVAVEHEEDGINIRSQMVEYNWNPLLKEYIDLTLGNYERNFTSTINQLDKIQSDIKNIHTQIELVYLSADGKNKIYSGETEPIIDQNSTEGDLWFKKNGDKTELWILRTVNGLLQWVVELSDATQEELKAAIKDAILQADKDRTKAEQDINQAVIDAKNYTEVKAQEFDNKLVVVNQNVTTITNVANASVTQANKAVEDAGFAKVDAASAKQTASAASGSALEALGLAKNATTNVNTLTTNYDALTQTVGFKAEKTVVDAVSKKVEQQTLAIAANAQQIDLRLTSTQVDTLVTQKGYATTNQLTATSGALTSLITGVEIDLANLKIGGRNLLLSSQSIEITPSTRYIQKNLAKPIKPNQKFTISIGYRKYFTEVMKHESVLVSPRDRKGTSGIGDAVGSVFTVSIGGSVTKEFTNSNQQIDAILFYSADQNVVSGNQEFYYEIQVEEGTKATGWSPAPEDMTTVVQFTELNQTVNSISGRVGNSEDQIAALVLQANGLQITVANKEDKTRVAQLANQWTQTTELVNGHTGQISNLGSQINLRVTSGQVTEAILADKTVKDTRNDNQLPDWYYTNYPRQTVEEFKTRVALGILGTATFGQLTTTVPWNNNAAFGVVITQTFRSSDGVFQRTSTSNGGAWLAWDKVAESGKLITQINLSKEGVLIQGDYIYLNGQTKMDNAFVTKMSAYSLDAVYADISTLKTRLLTADVITSTMLKSDTALIDKLFATDANVQRLTAKTAFINSIKAVDIAADKITGGVFNAALMNVVGLNANSMTTGTLNGSNMSLNLNTGTYESTQYQANEVGTQMKVSAVDISKGNLTTYSYLEPQRAVLSSGSLSLEVLAGSDPKSAKKVTDINLTGAGISFSSYNTSGVISRSRLLEAISEGLIIRPTAGTGTDLNTSLHLKGGGTGSYQYIQFISGDNIVQRLETEGQYMTAYHGGNGAFQVAKYGDNPNSGLVISGVYETRHSTGVSLRIAGDSISTPRDGARNIFLVPQGVGSVISGNSSGVRYNMVASDFVKQSSRTTKKIIGPIKEGLTAINRLTAITYYKLSKLNDGIIEIEKGFISEDSPDVATTDGKGIYDSHITAHLVKAVQELDVRTASEADQLKQEIKKLKKRIQKLEKRIQKLESAA
ncbi:MAG: phage tail spike protein [Carnobacterium sp.]|uniref:phage tail spike protein n=1 Tax=Carnobacterium sp. TaxID=48221 RepID=UPI0033151E97